MGFVNSVKVPPPPTQFLRNEELEGGPICRGSISLLYGELGPFLYLGPRNWERAKRRAYSELVTIPHGIARYSGVRRWY